MRLQFSRDLAQAMNRWIHVPGTGASPGFSDGALQATPENAMHLTTLTSAAWIPFPVWFIQERP